MSYLKYYQIQGVDKQLFLLLFALFGLGTNVAQSSSVTRALGSQLRELGFTTCAAVSNLGQVSSLYIAQVHSDVQTSTWL